MREQLVIAGALSTVDPWVDAVPIAFDENMQADVSSPADEAGLDSSLEQIAGPMAPASRTLAAIAMLAAGGGLSNSIGQSSVGRAGGSSGSPGGSLVGGSFVPRSEASLVEPPQIAGDELDNAGNPSLSASREIIDKSDDFPGIGIVDEADSATDVSPIGEFPVFGATGLRMDESGGLQGSTSLVFDTTVPADDSTAVPEPGTLLLLFGAMSAYGARRGLTR